MCLVSAAALGVLLLAVWPTWPVVVLLSDLAQLLPGSLTELYVPRFERMVVSAGCGLGAALVLGLASTVSLRLLLSIALLLGLVPVVYPEARALALRLAVDAPAELEIEAGHPGLGERLRFAFVDSGLDPKLADRNSVEGPCRISKQGKRVEAIAAESGMFKLPRFLEGESLGHDWVAMTYRTADETVSVAGLRSGGRQSARLRKVLRRSLEGAAVSDARRRCHELWPLLVDPLQQEGESRGTP